MNKKFSTLLATALVAGSFSAFAQTKAVAGDDILVGAKTGDYVSLLDAGNDYLVAKGAGVVKTNTGLSALNAATSIEDAFAAMWQVTIIPSTTTAGVPTYQFVNKQTNERLALVLRTNGAGGVSTTEATLDEAGNDIWGWNSKLGFYAVEGDSTFFLSVSGNKAVLTAVKGGLNEAMATSKTPFILTPTSLKNEAALDLTETSFNALVGKSGKLYFKNNKDVKNSSKGNILTAKKWKAASAAVTANSKTFFLASEDSSSTKNPYLLVVDTLMYDLAGKDLNVLNTDTLAKAPAYTNGGLTNLADLKYTDNKFYRTEGTGNKAKYYALRPAESAMFGGQYFFGQDSLVLKAINKPAVIKADNGKLNVITAGAAYASANGGLNGGQIALRVLDADKIVLTPAPDKTDLSTEAKAKEANFILPLIQPAAIDAADDNRASIADGLYFIKNAKDQYCAIPIENTRTKVAKWVTVKDKEQMPAHMPAYQWVVLKNSTSDKVKDVVAVTIANREFDGPNSVQLYKNPGAKYYYLKDKADSLDFVLIEDTKEQIILGDSLLGYMNVTDKNDLDVKAYKLNYLHPYATDKYIAKSTDSLITVLKGETAFKLKAGAIADYGFKVTKNVSERIKGLKQLRRNTYVPYVKTAKGDMTLGVNKEGQYFLSTYGEAIPFYFKANNDYQPEGASARKCYYALINLVDAGLAGNADSTKVGVTDDDMAAVLKDQVLAETRTSAFAVVEDNTPLYRRFDTALESVAANDGPDTLRFVEQYRHEYLQIEGNSNFTHKGIDFLGIYSDDKAPSGLAFIVDTAWVKRGNGEIKPQYLISIERKDKEAEKGHECTESGKHYDKNGHETTAANCVHATPATPKIELGKYLVNFADSAKVKGKEDIYQWKKYTRAGFVKAAHVGDDLYILNGMFADVTAATLDTALIRAAVKDKKYAAKYIIDLKGDEHKLVTWSFRYVDPAKAATDDKRFLIESMATDGENIAPKTANWLKMQNGCLVLSDDQSTFDVFTQDDDALIFDVEYKANDEVATDSKTPEVSAISVVATEGAVIVKGAAGKTVAITNVLGQTIASKTITSDEATIAVPAGVVFVAVEGETAVKAMVK